MRYRISAIRIEAIQGISVFVGLLVIVGVSFFAIQNAYQAWHSYYMVPSNEYHLKTIIGRSIEALVGFFIATLIFTPERFYRRRPIQVMGFLFGGVSTVAALMVFPMAAESLRLLFLRGITWEHLVDTAMVYSGPFLILALCSAAILLLKAFRAQKQT